MLWLQDARVCTVSGRALGRLFFEVVHGGHVHVLMVTKGMQGWGRAKHGPPDSPRVPRAEGLSDEAPIRSFLGGVQPWTCLRHSLDRCEGPHAIAAESQTRPWVCYLLCRRPPSLLPRVLHTPTRSRHPLRSVTYKGASPASKESRSFA